MPKPRLLICSPGNFDRSIKLEKQEQYPPLLSGAKLPRFLRCPQDPQGTSPRETYQTDDTIWRASKANELPNTYDLKRWRTRNYLRRLGRSILQTKQNRLHPTCVFLRRLLEVDEVSDLFPSATRYRILGATINILLWVGCRSSPFISIICFC